jgi:hypothetical protein
VAGAFPASGIRIVTVKNASIPELAGCHLQDAFPYPRGFGNKGTQGILTGIPEPPAENKASVMVTGITRELKSGFGLILIPEINENLHLLIRNIDPAGREIIVASFQKGFEFRANCLYFPVFF